MKIGNYTLRSPIVKYAELDLGEELYSAMRSSILEDIANEMEENHKYNLELIKSFVN